MLAIVQPFHDQRAVERHELRGFGLEYSMMGADWRRPEDVSIAINGSIGGIVGSNMPLSYEIFSIAFANGCAKFLQPYHIRVGQQPATIGARPSINCPPRPIV